MILLQTLLAILVSGASGGPVLEAYETSSGPAKAASGSDDWAQNVSRIMKLRNW